MPELGRSFDVVGAVGSEVWVVLKPSSVCALEVDLAAKTGTILYFHGPAELKDAVGS